MAANLVERIQKHMDAFRFIEDVAVDWDDTYLKLNRETYVPIARKAKGTDNWFVGGITNKMPGTAGLLSIF